MTNAETIGDYINSFPEDVQDILKKLQATIRKAAPRAEESINYGIPTFTLKGNLVHFGAFKNHIGFYPAPSGIRNSRRSYRAMRAPKGQ